MIKFFKKLFKKIEVRSRRKDKNAVNEPIKDYGDFDVSIIYCNNYLDTRLQNEEYDDIIEMYVVFSVVIDLNQKDLVDDYFNNLIPFIKTIKDIKYIEKIIDNKIYTYIGIYRWGFVDIFKLYYPDGNISYILSNIISVFNEELNNEILEKYIPENYINRTDKIPENYLSPVRSYKLENLNILMMDKIPNIKIDYNNEWYDVFDIFDLLYMSNIVIYNSNILKYSKYFKYIYLSNMVEVIPLLKTMLENRDVFDKIIKCIENDSYFNIKYQGNNINLLSYAQHCKLLYNNIIGDTDFLYDDIDEFVDDDIEADYIYTSIYASNSHEDDDTINEY